MLLKELISGIETLETDGSLDIEISGLCFDSRTVKQGDLFFALRGSKADGHNFAYSVFESGAAAIVCEAPVPVSLPQIIVKNSRSALAGISSAFYGNPSEKLKIIGVTGTNGKTSTTFIIKSIAEAAGINVAVLGTSGLFYDDIHMETGLTTPDPIELNRLLALLVENNIELLAMEVSAHALALNKVEGIKFETGVFTNLSQDHLDYFGDMETYKKAKMKFFSPEIIKNAVVNNDDITGIEIYNNERIKSYGYGLINPADTFAIDVSYDKGVKFTVNVFDDLFELESGLYGKFNVYNILAAVTACYINGMKRQQIIDGIKKLKEISGRFNVINAAGGYKVIIDYAHTPDGMKNVLKAARGICLNKLYCVFGCGGDRDKTKRKIMGFIASEQADFCVITSDNPRFEDPMTIINDIEKGMIRGKSGYICIENRRNAIKYALLSAKRGDVVAILGKGAENFQEFTGIKHPYSDAGTVHNFLGNRE